MDITDEDVANGSSISRACAAAFAPVEGPARFRGWGLATCETSLLSTSRHAWKACGDPLPSRAVLCTLARRNHVAVHNANRREQTARLSQERCRRLSPRTIPDPKLPAEYHYGRRGPGHQDEKLQELTMNCEKMSDDPGHAGRN